MPGVHTYLQCTVHLNLHSTLTHGPGSWTLQEKEVKMDPAHGPPLQARVAAANRTVSQLANMLFDDPGAHGMDRWANKAKMN